MTIAVVTDSTAYLPDELVLEYGIDVVPLQVVIAGESYDEDETTSGAVAEALRRWVPVTTSRPAPKMFHDAYCAATERGATGLVSIHLSAEMSGTYDAAVLAAQDAPLPVRVLDSRGLGMALGFAVLAAAQSAEMLGTLAEVAAAAEKRAAATSTVFYVDTLEYLRRGGRIGPAAALLGSALAVKPLLRMKSGHIEPLEKVRTASRAIARLEEVSVEAAGSAEVDVAVHHLASAARAEQVAQRLRSRIPSLREMYVSEVGAVVGAHVGPGMLAVVVSPT